MSYFTRHKSYWRNRAAELIHQITADLPADATPEQRRKALWGKGWPAHQGTSWGRKMWGREVRAYLAQHGTGGRVAIPAGTTFPAHIHFPFRTDLHPAPAEVEV